MDALALGKQPFVKFSIIGGLATGVQYLLLITAVQFFNCPVILSSCTAFLVSTVLSYFLNHRFTFASDKSHKKAIWQYFLVYLFSCGINATVMWIGHHGLGLHYLLAQVIASFVVLFWNYNCCRLWVLKT